MSVALLWDVVDLWAVLLLACVLGLLLVGVWWQVSERRLQRQLAAAHQALARFVDGGDDDGWFRRLSRPVQLRLLLDVGAVLAGEEAVRLASLAADAGWVDRAVAGTRSRLWWRRLQAVRILTVLRAGGEAVPRLLADPHPMVRIQAAEWAAEQSDPGLAEVLVASLAASDVSSRFAVQDTLVRLGPLAAPALLAWLTASADQDVAPILQVAAVGEATPAFLPVALSLSGHPASRVRELCAVMLGRLGGEAAVERLQGLARDPQGAVRAAAAASLGRLGQWQLTPVVGNMLRDPDWAVRRAAGLALERLGNPGLLWLRRALEDPDPFAADMARQILDLRALTSPL